jgi:hypothetical protein
MEVQILLYLHFVTFITNNVTFNALSSNDKHLSKTHVCISKEGHFFFFLRLNVLWYLTCIIINEQYTHNLPYNRNTTHALLFLQIDIRERYETVTVLISIYLRHILNIEHSLTMFNF